MPDATVGSSKAHAPKAWAAAGKRSAFDATGWLARWLREPSPALGGKEPIGLLDTMEGQALVARALAQMQSGAYA